MEGCVAMGILKVNINQTRLPNVVAERAQKLDDFERIVHSSNLTGGHQGRQVTHGCFAVVHVRVINQQILQYVQVGFGYRKPFDGKHERSHSKAIFFVRLIYVRLLSIFDLVVFRE